MRYFINSTVSLPVIDDRCGNGLQSVVTIKNAFPTERHNVFYPPSRRKSIRLWAHEMNRRGFIEVCNLEPNFPITNQFGIARGVRAWFEVVFTSLVRSVIYRNDISQTLTLACCWRWHLNQKVGMSWICFELRSIHRSCDHSGCSLSMSDTFGTLD